MSEPDRRSTDAPGLFGRDRELREAEEALAAVASGTPRVLLVGGDAGIGKTALAKGVGERAAARGFTVLTGHCLDIGHGTALQPVREALRTAVASRADHDLPPVTRRMTGFLRGEDAGANLDDIGLVVGELAAEGPLLVVLEDMHSADQSTRDLAVMLAHTTAGPVCLLLTYRTDELTRRHPFRSALVELGRSPGAHRLELAPLDRDGIAGIVEATTGAPDGALAGSLLARSEGNPLYAEELLASGPHELPASLSDLLLARVDSLPAPARDLLRVASVHGSRLDPALLADAMDVPAEQVDDLLRDATDANVLRSTGDHLDFRHGLLREAVHDDLLPGERARAHAALATALQRRLHDGTGHAELAMLAFHWYAAHDLPEAFAASVRAGVAARQRGGPEAIAHLTRALELYDQVPPHVDTPPKADLLRWCAEVCVRNGQPDRGDQLIAEALELVDETTDPLLASRVYTSYASLCGELEGYLGHGEAVDLAITLVDGTASVELARALATKSETLLRYSRFHDSQELAGRAIEVAGRLAAPLPDVEMQAWQTRAWAEFSMGRMDDAVRSFARARRAAVLARNVEEAVYDDIGLIYVLGGGVDRERGIALGRELGPTTRAQGLPMLALRTQGILALALVADGRLDEADLLLTELLEQGMHPQSLFWSWARSRLLVLRGQPAAALDVERQRMAVNLTLAKHPDAMEIGHHVAVLLANDLFDEATSVSREYAATYAEGDGCLAHATMAATLYAVALAGHRGGMPLDPDVVSQADALLERALAAAPPDAVRHWDAVDLLVAPALRREVRGETTVEAWRQAHAAAVQMGLGAALPVRLQLARAMLAEGLRDAARTELPELYAEAQAAGATGITTEAARLARRHRIPIGDDGAPSRLDVLTPREREVLDVLATGATNRTIAERLFISEKTVSVHVTNLLAKLGAANRGEAAALARELAPAD